MTAPAMPSPMSAAAVEPLACTLSPAEELLIAVPPEVVLAAPLLNCTWPCEQPAMKTVNKIMRNFIRVSYRAAQAFCRRSRTAAHAGASGGASTRIVSQPAASSSRNAA